MGAITEIPGLINPNKAAARLHGRQNRRSRPWARSGEALRLARKGRTPMVQRCAPRYYYVLFEDPDGIRLEVNLVPGQGVLAQDARLNPGKDFQ